MTSPSEIEHEPTSVTVMEDEVRWLITKMDHGMLAQLTPERIQQGYLGTNNADEKSLRVRISDGLRANLTHKTGTGRIRPETTQPITLEAALPILASCPDTLEKWRYRVTDGWEIDVFQDVLSGIVLAEWERPQGFEGPTPAMPPWITSAVEVTETMTNYHLARLATKLKALQSPSAITAVEQLLAPKIPMVVLTGGPGAGKTTILREIQAMLGSLVLSVPEVATILITLVGAIPNSKDQMGRLAFQRAVRATQLVFEEIAQQTARDTGKKLIVLDRGLLDSIAYLDDGARDYERIAGDQATRRDRERYRAVIQLAVPAQEIYDRCRHTNPGRYESHVEAAAVGERIKHAWSGHSSHHLLTSSDFDQQRSATFELLYAQIPDAEPLAGYHLLRPSP